VAANTPTGLSFSGWRRQAGEGCVGSRGPWQVLGGLETPLGSTLRDVLLFRPKAQLAESTGLANPLSLLPVGLLLDTTAHMHGRDLALGSKE
jgi:hypothetical protein